MLFLKSMNFLFICLMFEIKLKITSNSLIEIYLNQKILFKISKINVAHMAIISISIYDVKKIVISLVCSLFKGFFNLNLYK